MAIAGKAQNELPHQFISRPDDSKDCVVYKWPDKNIKYLSVVTVQPDEWAFFIKRGRIVGYLKPGEQRLDGASVPFLRELLDKYTSNNVLMSELYFVSAREFANNKFGGSMGALCDPGTDVMVNCGVYGEFTFRVTNPEKLVLNLLGTKASVGNGEITGVIRDHMIKLLRVAANKAVLDQGWDILRVTSGAYSQDFENLVVPNMPKHIERFGLELTALEDFVISVLPQDKHKLQEIHDRRAKMKLAENDSYSTMAEAEAVLGAAKGLQQAASSGMGDMAGMGLGVGLGMGIGERMAAGVAFDPADVAPPPPAMEAEAAAGMEVTVRGPEATVCPSCGEQVAPGRFCSECGAPMRVE